jgi:phosphatidylserine decarboxylase
MWDIYILGLPALVGVLLLLVRKMELPLKWVMPWILIVSPISLWLASRSSSLIPGSSLILRIILGLFLSLGASILLVVALFFRDPRRQPPIEPRTILSPADGRIIYIQNVEDHRFPIAVKKGKDIPLDEFTGIPFPLEQGFQIGIMMSCLDVHINRAPIAGTVERMIRIPGAFHSLKRLDSLLENERVFSIIAGPGIRLGMVQIASRLVRRIVPFVKEGDRVKQGDKIGLIRFGSQVDLFIPRRVDLKIVAKVGDYVKAGLSILARLNGRDESPPEG